MKIDIMVEQTNQSENSFMKSERLNGGKTGHTRIEDASYDKDVVEIKLPDTVFSSDYGGHFVKDVCIDEGVHAEQKTSTAKLQKFPLDFESSTGDIKGDLREEIRESKKSAHELKSQVVILPVMCATENNTEEQYSSPKPDELEGSNTASVFTNLNNETSSPQQPRHESANGSQQIGMIISEVSENQDPLNGGEIHEVSSTDFHGTGIGIASETSNNNHNDFPVELAANELAVVMPEEDAVSTELDKGGSNQINHYNPFIAYGSLDDTWEPKYSLPTIVDAPSIAPICPVEKTDSFSDLVNRSLAGFDSVGIAEAIIEENRSDYAEASSSSLDGQVSEESNVQRENLTHETRTNVAHDRGMETSLSTSNAEPSDVKSEGSPKCEIDNNQNVNDFNPRDEVGTKRNEENTDSKSSTHVQTEPVIQQSGPDSAKMTTQSVLRNPFESSFSGPSITSGPLTPSGHIPYSGNISLRSESSTTSTRSFAFPVLQTEWNSSPVKMAKADRRRLREDRGWSYRILCCCKF